MRYVAAVCDGVFKQKLEILMSCTGFTDHKNKIITQGLIFENVYLTSIGKDSRDLKVIFTVRVVSGLFSRIYLSLFFCTPPKSMYRQVMGSRYIVRFGGGKCPSEFDRL